MADNPQTPKKSITPDWFVQGALTRIGDTLDMLTGRRWRPSSSLATSGLIERMKMLLDREMKKDQEGRSFVPHNIKLKMQWDKFSTDSEESLKKLEHEMLTAAVDHISDNRYYTHAPLHVEVKPDYFTEGVKLFVSFDDFAAEHEREGELNVTVPAAKASDLMAGLGHALPVSQNLGHSLSDNDGSSPNSPPVLGGVADASSAGVVQLQGGELVIKFDLGQGETEKRFSLTPGQRLSIGRTRENAIAIDHTSVSKMHASLLMSSAGKLLIADTGSTNGTYLNGDRIAYGKAIEMSAGDKVKFGAIEVELDFTPHAAGQETISPDDPTEAYIPLDLHVSTRMEVLKPVGNAKSSAIGDPPVAGDKLEKELP